ncbi:uncharacterized protein K452DRAFT_307490 [Aplosporella prunicola CBS 121167]|uniref:Protein kinase domain-containing protein n=1 Tax=Aplosporella prunicola CBS 121167 TaxID=1176127 RepID=A0A6A6BH88_9PEZI|nr:uncharacterized protein K452DRAFT_307490 [Aplosporella prunicola CBS 121167]KAF2143346.1 hypothetical protein K452DRAFT_307490 [Aplosporella prunicola CBS 121167]
MTGYKPPSVEDCQSDGEPSDDQGSAPRPQSPIQNLSTRLKAGIGNLIGLPGDAHATKIVLRNSIMTRISEILDLYCNQGWCLRPRTFAILWWLGCPLDMEQFVKDGLTDHFIPYSLGNLPKVIRGKDRSRFLELQKRVLPQEDLAGLEISGGQHIHFPKEDESDEQFEQMKVLGNGAYAIVDRVRSRTSLDQFARKRIHRFHSSHLRDKKALIAFENELKTLKALDHKHLVKLISTYTDPTYVGLLIKPVADMDLATYLGPTKDPLERKACLRAFFGCLANALWYLHKNHVRHKDIKPMNILVKGTNVYFTDFGTARQWEGEGDGSTSGLDTERTPRYCAPEVGDRDRRGKPSDIWSLGCVFLEMATVLNNESVIDFRGFLETNGTQRSHYWQNSSALAMWIQHLRESFKASDDLIILQWLEWMLQESPRDRPDSLQLLNEIRENQGETSFIGSCCTAVLENLPSKQLLPNEPLKIDIQISDSEPPKTPQQKVPEPSKASDPPDDSPVVSDRRFILLSSDRRPAPTPDVPEEDHGDREEDLYNVLAPAPLEPPSLCTQGFTVPRSTLVPSYILACSNRFTRQEATAPKHNHGRVNLFVCGRFMFPSVIRAIAARSTESEYSKVHQRRLMPTADDWANVNKTLKHAAEAMTTAVLRGYDRWKPKGIDCAVLQQSDISPSIIEEISRNGYPTSSKPSGEVQGFIIRGLTREALRYCDLLLCGSRSCAKKLQLAKGEDQKKGSAQPDGPKGGLMRQEEVSVEIRLKSGELTKVKAQTYIWTQGSLGLCGQWDPTAFIQKPGLRSLSSGALDWTAEERKLAKTMRTDYVFPGDILCSKVLNNQPEAVSSLLSQMQVDPDAPCRFFATTLQAAASLGDEELVNMLLDSGANSDANGGHYGSPLMAAVVHSRKTVAKMLLKERANVFVHGARFVSPLYQAVGHSDWAMAQLLLDKGAWLGAGYDEILDLAAEQRDADMKRLLVDYDVQGLHDSKPGYEFARRLRPRSAREPKSSSLGGVVLEEIWANCGSSGTWRGLKGANIARAALAAGADPSILMFARKAIDPVLDLLSLLRAQVKDREESRGLSTHDMVFERVVGSTSSRRSRKDAVGGRVGRRNHENGISKPNDHLRHPWGSPPPYSRLPN